MPRERALVHNAADPAQVKGASRIERSRDERFMAATKQALQSPTVREVFAELLERAGLYQSVFDHSGSVMNFKEGRRNFGLELFALLERADERATELMEQERRARRRKDNNEVDATHTTAAAEGVEEP